ncbi:MAG TPA: phospholipase D-like domain-containing protein [Chloroflexota bacterium]|nr:phospholipase D-like domain-containing protein [Chloroflexota bacterium]
MRRVALVLFLTLLGIQPHAAAARDSLSAFSEPGQGDSPALSLIGSARHSIRLEVYEMTDRTVEAALGRAARRGVNVRVMLEERPYGGGRYAREAYDALRSDGVNVRWANEGAFTYTHEKAMVVDTAVAGIFTFNLTGSGQFSNREFGVIDRSAPDARTLAAVFDADWARRTPRIGSTRLVLSPINARSDLDRLISGAHHTLDVYAEEVDDADLESRLTGAAHHHVRVRLITSADSSGVSFLRRGGVKVHIMASPYVHAKAIVADRNRVFIGSENISFTSLDHNREAGILVTDRAVANVVERTFRGDWGGSGAPPPVTPPPPPAGSHGVQVTASPSSVTRGQLLTITARTTNGASCGITVTYPDGYVSHAGALQGQKTAAGGTVSWSWHVGSTVTGTARADVRCTVGNRTETGSTTFQIT